jgi:hypothetical protein
VSEDCDFRNPRVGLWVKHFGGGQELAKRVRAVVCNGVGLLEEIVLKCQRRYLQKISRTSVIILMVSTSSRDDDRFSVLCTRIFISRVMRFAPGVH